MNKERRAGEEDPRVLPAGAAAQRSGPGRRISGSWLAAIALGAGVLLAVLGTSTPQPRLDWSEASAPQRILNAHSLIPTSNGFAVLAGPEFSGGRLWSSADGFDWTGTDLPRLASRVVEFDGRLLIVDGRSVSTLDANGRLDLVDVPGIVRLGNGSDRTGMISTPDGLLFQTLIGDLFWSPDGSTFELAVPAPTWRSDADTIQRPFAFDGSSRRFRSNCDAVARRAPDIPPLVATTDSFVALIPTIESAAVWPVCEPIPWTSADGVVWEPALDESPFLFGGYVFEAGWREGRFIAVGGLGFDQPSAWTSTDGLQWSQLTIPEADRPVDLTGIAPGELGWVMTATPRDGSDPISWYSHNGTCWEPLPDGVHGEAVAVGDDRIVMIDTSPAATVWVGTPAESFAFVHTCV